MSQLIACQTAEGIVVAADGKAIDFDEDGSVLHYHVERLVPLGSHAAILAGGAADGVDMCRAFASFVREEGLIHVDDIYSAGLPFLGSQYDRFMREKCERLPLDPVHHVHFILAGHTAKDDRKPFRLYLIWTKKKLPQLDGDEIAHAYTVPRRMSLEYRLNKMCQRGAPLDEVFAQVKENMESLTWYKEEVGPPFYYAKITKDGLSRLGG